MSVISVFLGIVIRVFQRDHNPPHIHVQYGEHKALLEISTGKTMAGSLPPRIRRIVLEWLLYRKAEVLKSWQEAQEYKTPSRVRPLE
ncbi:MAG: DUF4160 domain-containing protein [Bdellovibrionales bacterium]